MTLMSAPAYVDYDEVDPFVGPIKQTPIFVASENLDSISYNQIRRDL